MFTGVQVAVDNAAFQFDRLWSYNVPEELAQYAVPGARVLVPFGRGAARSGIIGDMPEGYFGAGFPVQTHQEWLRMQSALRKLPALMKRIKELEKKAGRPDACAEKAE